ncbi:MAG TPA: COX15/CtaA family protein [Verrucomicrobiae bacterium]|nr:COX15/CtaA family protein [Verrucomicrobiae bacterium]
MTLFRWLTTAALSLCVVVVVFGAYVRLSDAGLGCPDWPGCYGHLTVPTEADHVERAQQDFPERPVEHGKAWKEMIHRYLASSLGLLVVGLFFLSFREDCPKRLPKVLLGLVIFQGLLGMWTVTLLLKPLIVTAHLLGGLATLSLLWWLWLGLPRAMPATPVSAREPRNEREAWAALGEVPRAPETPRGLQLAAAFALVLVIGQIFLGGWTSSNYAALACPDLPTCHGTMTPELNVGEAFTLWRGLGRNYEYGVLDNRARVTIHWLHRIGALVLSVVIVAIGAWLLRAGPEWRRLGHALLGALTLQAIVGVTMVATQLPLLLAAAHNAGAALLLLVVIMLNQRAWRSAQ